MAKQSGYPAKVQADDAGAILRNISGDVTSFEISTPSGMQEITGVDKSALERLLLLADGKVSLKGVLSWDDVGIESTALHVLKSIATARIARTVTIDPSGTAGGSARLSMEILFTSFEISRGEDGSLGWSAEGELADGTVPVWTTV